MIDKLVGDEQGGEEDDDGPMRKGDDNGYSEEEYQEALTVLNKFLIASESPFMVDIDIVLMMKALPTPIATYVLEQ